MGTGARDVVFPVGPHLGGPQREALGIGDDLNVAARPAVHSLWPDDQVSPRAVRAVSSIASCVAGG